MAVRGGQANAPSRKSAGTGRRGRATATTGGTANRGVQSSLNPGGGHTRQDSVRRQSGRHNMQEMSESQVVGFLGRKIWQSMNDEDGDLSDVRKENFNYYYGADYGDERDGYSKFVTRESFETVEWVLPSVLRVFLAGDKVVSFEPVGPEDEEQADQETDITNYFVMKKNKNGEGGFTALHHWMKDCLMYPNGYIKCWMEEKLHTDVGIVTGLTDVGVAMLEQDEDVEIIAQRSRMIQVPMPTPAAVGGAPAGPMQPPIPGAMPGATNNMMGNPAPMSPGGQPNPNDPPPQMQAPPPNVQNVGPTTEMEVFDLKIRTTKNVMQLRIDPVPPEECLVDNDCVSLNLDDADFVCHRVRKPYTQLVNEGYDPDELDQVGLGEDYQWNDERVNRLFYEDEDPDAEDEDDPSMRTFWVHECYAWFDYEGTGIAQHRRVVLIGDRVFENEETNYQPMVAMASILMQHKHTGMGYIETVKDLQLLSSVLVRQMLDNTYKQNVDKTYISEDALTEDGSTMEALLNTQAEYVPVRGPAQAAIMKQPPNSIIQQLLPVIEYVKTARAERTGVTPDATVDANALQEVRQEVFTNALDRASQRIEMLVRIFAETGYRQLFLKAHQLLRSHWDLEQTIKLRGKWVDVDPQGWRDRTDLNINVGLGYNTKPQQLGLLVQLLSMQKEALAQGMSDYRRVFNTLERLVTAAGLGDVRQYFIDPDSPEFQPPQPQPDPQAILAQAQAQALGREQDRKDAEAQAEIPYKQAEMQGKAVEMQLKAQNEEADRQLKVRDLAIREAELEKKYEYDGAELAAKIENIRADTEKKRADADKSMTEAAANMIENSETFQKAVDIVADANDENAYQDLTLQADYEDAGSQTDEDETETE